MTNLHDFSRHNRKNLTPAEASLWKLLKGKQFAGRKFRRQHIFGNYIVDFCCLAERLVIELDGYYHKTQKEYDKQRDEYLKSLGLTILRFENKMVFEQPEYLLKTIKENFKSEISFKDANNLYYLQNPDQ